MTTVQKGFIYLCLLSTLISEMLLSPFFPQLFSTYFQVEGVQATSLYISVCRIVVIVMTPIWTIFLKKWGLKLIIPVGLFAMGSCKFLLPTVTSFEQFLLISILLLFFQSSIYLLYPALVAASKNEQEKLKGTTTYLFIFHGSVIVSGLLGSFAINQSVPLNSYYIFAFCDLVLAIGCWLYLPKQTRQAGSEEKKKGAHKENRWQGELIVYLLIVFLFFLGHQAIRPYLTMFLEQNYTLSNQSLSLMYVMPSLVAIFLQGLLPRGFLKAHIRVILLALIGLTGIMVFLQTTVDQVWSFIFVRVIYSVGFFVSLIGMDLLFFQLGIGKRSPLSYSLVISTQNIALLFAPMSALVMVELSGFKGPFLLSGLLLIGSAIGLFLLFYIPIKSSIYIKKKGVGQREDM